jgi:hypothetical protein
LGQYHCCRHELQKWQWYCRRRGFARLVEDMAVAALAAGINSGSSSTPRCGREVSESYSGLAMPEIEFVRWLRLLRRAAAQQLQAFSKCGIAAAEAPEGF